MKPYLPLYMSSSYLDKHELYQMSQVVPECQVRLDQLRKTQEAFRHWKTIRPDLGWRRAHLGLLRNRFPVLTYQDRFCGGTSYLDGITSNDVDSPIMEGKDDYRRVFFTIRYKCLDKEFRFDGKTYPIDPDRLNCLTIFQRYTDSNTWCKADSRAPLLYGSPTSLSDEALDLLVSNLFRMMTGLPIIYYDYQNKSDWTPSVKRYLRCQLV